MTDNGTLNEYRFVFNDDSKWVIRYISLRV